MIELEYIGAPPARPQTATLSDYYAESLAEEPESGGSKFWVWAPLIGLAWGYYFLSAAMED